MEKWRDYNQQMGATYSAYEHLIPEQLFSTEDEPVGGISAVKALAIASQQGQRIYTFTEDNLSYLSDLTVDQGTKDEIQAQVNNGMVATVHQHPITYAGWTGTGYTIVHPETGAGSYKISGGSDGSIVIAVLSALTNIAATGFSIASTGLKVLAKLESLAVVARHFSAIGVLVSVLDAAGSGCSVSELLGVILVGLLPFLVSLALATVILGPIIILLINILVSQLAGLLQDALIGRCNRSDN
ncbi:hypothetical protein [Oceanicoccus sagamiensis]|uniref:hypothetical protein n=1 Tax=Oceanicoccus sagamiensis TaxID=716816 RepID=UPI0012F48F19|nr:hypothetical protein [Oceanicoccus sagamiensis]